MTAFLATWTGCTKEDTDLFIKLVEAKIGLRDWTAKHDELITRLKVRAVEREMREEAKADRRRP